ncbi:MAG: arabinose isomerase [Prevotella sp.]|nr:arabinose isomerase [Prevotella sp.]
MSKPLVETKARVGVFSIALGAYLPQFPQLVPEFQAQYEAFKKTLPTTVDIIDGGMVTTKEQSQAAGDKFRAADVDLVILQLLTYATSYNMLPAVRDLDVPVVLVNVQKKLAPDYQNTDIPTWLGELYACGAVGEMVADLERAGKRHAVITGVVEGGDPQVKAEIEDWCRAAQVRRRFRDTNIAQIGRPYPGMMDLYIDETNLYHRMWLYTKQFDWEKMWAIADNITDEAAIRAKAEDILNTFDILEPEGSSVAREEGGNSIEKVWDMARYVVAFEQWVKDEQLGLIASHYDGFAQGVAGKLDSMLIPAFSMLIKQHTACAVEGDMKVAMAMSILKTISGTGTLSEMYSIDFNEDICIIGHSGSGDFDISQAKKPTMKIVPVFHGKSGGGYLTQFYPPVGDVTYLGITQDRNGVFKFVVAEGVNEPGPIFTFGDTNMRTRFSIGAREFCNRWSEAGPTHHMAAAVGRHIDTILKVAKIFNVEVDVVCR